MRALWISVVAAVCLLGSQVADADPIFDFDDAVRTFLGGSPPDPVPGTGDFNPTLGPTQFLVGNLTNFCGLYPPRDPRSGVGTGCPALELASRIDYDSSADDFTLSRDTLLQLQVIIKVGHPEEPDLNSSRRTQNQMEEFDIFLQGSGPPLELAQLLDDIDATMGDEQNGYYLYDYGTALVPAGTWYPYFVAQHGSIEFLTQLSKPVPEPGTMLLFASGLAGLAFAGWRRRRAS